MSSKVEVKKEQAKVVKPPPKPKNVKFSRALFPYTSKEEDELSFEEGDLLYIIDDSSDPDWWRARLGHLVRLNFHIGRYLTGCFNIRHNVS